MKEKLSNIILILVIIWIFFLMFVGVSWGVGYYSNAFSHSNWYNLSSCMMGISTAGGALGSILMLAFTNFLHEREVTKRYNIDSKHNSRLGQKPNDRRTGAE